MSVVDKLIIELSFDDVGFEKSAKKVNESVKKVSKTTEDELKKGLNKKIFEDQSKVVVNVMSNTAKSISSVLTKGLAGIGAIVGAKFAIEFAQAFGEKGKNLELNASVSNFNRQGGQLLEKLFGRVGNSTNAIGVLSNLSKSINSFTGNPNLAKFLGQIGKPIYDDKGQKKSTDTLTIDVIKGLRDYIQNAGKEKALAAFNEVGMFSPEVFKLAELPPEQFDKLIKDILPTIVSDETIQKQTETANKWAALNDRIAKIQADSGDVLYDATEKLINLFEYIGNALAPAVKLIYSTSDLLGGLIGGGGYRGAKLNYNEADLQNPEKRKIIEAELKNQKTMPDYFKKLYNNVASSAAGLGKNLKDTSPFSKTNTSPIAVPINSNVGNFNDLKNQISKVESTGGTNINDRILKGKKYEGFGAYQVSNEAFRDVHGRNMTNSDKMNQTLLDETAEKYWQLGIDKYNARTLTEQLAFWNGGPEAIQMVRNGNLSGQKGQNLQKYINKHIEAGTFNNPVINPAELNSKSSISNTTSKSVTNNFHGDIQLPGVKNTTDFAKNFGSIGSNDGTIYGFSRGYT